MYCLIRCLACQIYGFSLVENLAALSYMSTWIFRFICPRDYSSILAPRWQLSLSFDGFIVGFCLGIVMLRCSHWPSERLHSRLLQWRLLCIPYLLPWQLLKPAHQNFPALFLASAAPGSEAWLWHCFIRHSLPVRPWLNSSLQSFCLNVLSAGITQVCSDTCLGPKLLIPCWPLSVIVPPYPLSAEWRQTASWSGSAWQLWIKISYRITSHASYESYPGT